jgi:formate hydrogenlyase subunit 3/multisubunit Na+/H+ antiporter MnhD subunit
MANTLTMAAIGLPLLVGLLLSVALRRVRPSAAQYVTLATTGLTTLLVLLLLPSAGKGPVIALEWLPGMGRMGLTTSATGLYAVLVTAGAAFLALFATASPPQAFSPLTGALMLLTLAASEVALLTDHFLARYVALEIVALCIALAAVVEIQGRQGIRQGASNYLLLRLGDVGMLTGIMLLMDISGTLQIAPALDHALGTLSKANGMPVGVPARWAVAGFLLAAWVKLGGWPFHLWKQAGERLSLTSQTWLYVTVMPNLGLYLLYRVTPLLTVADPVRQATLWIGGGAALAGLLALKQARLIPALIYQEAAQAGLVLFLAATGIKEAVWLSLFVLTPLRLLLFLAADIAQRATATHQRRIAASFLALGGLGSILFNMLIIWWAGETGSLSGALVLAQAAVALIGVHSARLVWRVLKNVHEADGHQQPARVPGTQWTTAGLLSLGIVGGGLAFVPFGKHLTGLASGGLPSMPSSPTLLFHALTRPAVLIVLGLSLATWRLQQRTAPRPALSTGPAEEAYDLEEGLTRAAQALRTVVEAGILERFVALMVRGVIDGARLAHRLVEQEGLEGLLYRAVRGVLALGRRLQRWHTGQLQHNLLWAVIGLALALLVFVSYGV